VLAIFEDSRENFWIGTQGGLDLFDRDKEEFKHYYFDGDQDYYLGNNNVNTIYEDQRGNLWIGSDFGLLLLNRETKQFEQIVFGNYPIASIHEDKLGYLWIGTQNNGVGKFNYADRKILWFGPEDGLPEYRCNTGSYNNQNQEYLFYGGEKGFSFFSPDSIEVNDHIPAIHINQFNIFNRPVHIVPVDSKNEENEGIIRKISTDKGDIYSIPKNINYLQNISITHELNNFSFEFSALNYVNAEKNQYAYIMEGYDEDWIFTDYQNRKATYTSLPAGRYTFKIKASNNHGYWNEEGVSLNITINPPWWETWWAQLLLYTSLMGIGIIIFQIRVSKIIQQREQLNRMVDLRTTEVMQQKKEIESQSLHLKKINQQQNKLFSIIAHDLKNPLNVMMGITTLLNPKTLSSEDLEKIKNGISERVEGLSAVMINLLDWAKGQMDGEVIRPEIFDIHQISLKMVGVFDPILIKKGIILKNQISEGNHVYADINHVRIILRNLISNAIKFTDKNGSIELIAESAEKEIKVTVLDTGVGIDKKQIDKLFSIETNVSSKGTAGEQGVGLGLLLVKDFTEKNGGNISVESTPGEGSKFSFTLPKQPQM
jgi:signal transduction histidine kinase